MGREKVRKTVVRLSALFLLVLAFASACSPKGGQQSQYPMATSELVLEADTGDQRWTDAGGNYYSKEYINLMSTASPAKGSVTYRTSAPTFTGTLKLRAFKPNFAYQLKLVGTPRDIGTMERIGYAGRWLLPGYVNVSDEQYEAFRDKRKAESFLVFDMIVTDGEGNADYEFALDSNWHVGMSETLEGAEPVEGMPVMDFAFTHFPERAYGTMPYEVVRSVRIWLMCEGRWTGARPEPGKTVLAEGDYNCTFRLTEESFHGAGGGRWATAADADVAFTIDHEAPR